MVSAMQPRTARSAKADPNPAQKSPWVPVGPGSRPTSLPLQIPVFAAAIPHVATDDLELFPPPLGVPPPLPSLVLAVPLPPESWQAIPPGVPQGTRDGPGVESPGSGTPDPHSSRGHSPDGSRNSVRSLQCARRRFVRFR